MLTAQSSFSCHQDPERAASEVVAGLATFSGVGLGGAALVFASSAYTMVLERVCRKLSERTGIRSIVACTAANVVSGASDPAPVAGISALAFAGDFEAEQFLIPDLRGHALEIGREIGRRAVVGSDRPTSVLLLADSYNLAPDELLAGFEDTAGNIPVVGAGASEAGSSGRTEVFADGSAASNAVAGLVLRGISLVPIRNPVFKPIQPWWSVTRAEANRVYELDGSAALPTVLEALPPTLRENPAESFSRIQVALAEPDALDDPLFRPVIAASPADQGLIVGDEVVVGMKLALAVLDPAAARAQFADKLRNLAAESCPSGLLYFHSALRGESHYGHPGIDMAYMRQSFSEIGVAGFASYLTMAPHRGRNRFHQFSGLLAGLAPGGPIRDEHGEGKEAEGW